MNIKIQCSCGTKFSFDVEPVDGKMPAEIFCPKCGADGTDCANQIIQQSSPAEIAAAPAVQKPRVRLNVVSSVATAPSGGESADGTPVQEKCARHPRNIASEHCVVCQKPICMECMQIFGYLCSIGCKYRADQEKIHVPKYKFQKNAVEKTALRKSIAIVSAVLVLLFAIIGAWFWYIMVGTKPRPYYSLSISGNSGAYAKFLGPNQILLLGKKQIALHDIETKKDVWSTALEDPKPAAETNAPAARNAAAQNAAKKIAATFDLDDFEDYSDYSSFQSEPVFKGEDVWLCLSHNVVGINLKTGAVKQTIPFKGRLSAFTPGESTLLVVSEKGPAKKLVTQINISSGEVKTQEVASSLREKVRVSDELPSNVLPTAALLLKRELEASEKGRPSLYKFSTEFFPAGQNMVEMQVKMVEPKVTSVATIKPAGPSKLNQDTRASADVGSVAEEIFNDMKRSSGGGYKMVDESRYAVLLRRTLENDATDWSGEVVGLPMFFQQKSVDVLVAGKKLILFDKQNKKTGEAQLPFPIDDSFTSGYSSGESAPCVETNATLYFFDQGGLTAFELPGATVKWRLPSVGISEIQFDEKGMMYVSTTTGSPEDIQYSEQIKMNDAPQPIILKVDPKLGKTLWKCDQTGGNFFLTGKFVYMTDASRGGFSMIHAVEDAFGTESSVSGSFRIVRVNPSNGKKMWAFTKSGAPENIDFSQNRILLHYGKEIQVMKFISF